MRLVRGELGLGGIVVEFLLEIGRKQRERDEGAAVFVEDGDGVVLDLDHGDRLYRICRPRWSSLRPETLVRKEG